jgi:hypothetical protein
MATLTWSATNATNCTASNGWSGSRATSGTLQVGPISAETTYALACSNNGGTAVSASTTIALTVPSTPTGLEAVTGGDSIVLMWASSTAATAITTYKVYRDGVHIGTSSAANPGTVYRQGTRFTDWEISRGGTYRYQVQAIDGSGEVSALSVATVVTAPTDTTPQPQVALDLSLTPELASWANEYVLPEVRAWYPKISDLIAYPNYTPPARFTVKFNPDYTGVAFADWRNGIIEVNPKYAGDNRQDLGMFIHEATHIIQSSLGFTRGWVIEGTADWAREYVYRDRAPIVPRVTDSYIQGYSQGSVLLEYFRQSVHSDSIRRANVALHNNIYHDGILTAQTTDASLDAHWLRLLNISGHDIKTGSVIASRYGGKCLDNYGYGGNDGNRIVSWTCTGTDNQYWSAVLNTDGTYALRVHSKCLDVSNSGTANGSLVQLWTCNWTGAQKWQLTGTTLVNANSGRCLDAGDLANGTQMRIWDCNGSVEQQWNVATATPTGAIRALDTQQLPNKCIENRGGNYVYGNPIVVSTCGAAGQQWTVVPVGGNVVLTVDGACMTVSSAGTANGTPIQYDACNATSAQQWTVVSGTRLRNPTSGRCLTANNSANDGTPFILYDCGASAYQQWRLPGENSFAMAAEVAPESVRITKAP